MHEDAQTLFRSRHQDWYYLWPMLAADTFASSSTWVASLPSFGAAVQQSSELMTQWTASTGSGGGVSLGFGGGGFSGGGGVGGVW